MFYKVVEIQSGPAHVEKTLFRSFSKEDCKSFKEQRETSILLGTGKPCSNTYAIVDASGERVDRNR
jgi:hypothetical protein